MFKSNQNPIKGIVFAGCSFTWGQGLYYYSNLPTLKEPESFTYQQNYVRFSHYQYLQSVRYPRLVANFFKTFEMCQPFNGGSTERITNWWNTCFQDTDDRNKSLNVEWSAPRYDYSDFSHIIFQCTQWTRSDSFASPEEQEILKDKSHIAFMQSDLFNPWLERHNMTLDEYIDRGITEEVTKIKHFLQNFENKGLKVYILSWPSDIVPYILRDEWLFSRFINFNYKHIRYDSLEKMMGESHKSHTQVPHPELTINRDFTHFKIPPDDGHPSMTCHKVIAENIINKIKKDFI